ncbi:class I SAM-dependent methyltransferase [Actinopolymorpha alba]|uniref:class I SAM-dependent methyltransferase n=1 Tax=Actinopolymorpha alba TaxID=533267 RepID=UPI0003727FAC|nr:class I SAM-dependent methyltransferase [Actinopolymorpha alba]
MRAGVRIVLAGALVTLLLLALPRSAEWYGLRLERVPNAVFLGGLLGLAFGLLRAGRPRWAPAYGPLVLALLVVWLAVVPLPPAQVAVPLAALASAAILAGYGELAGRTLRAARPAGLRPVTALALAALGALAGSGVDAALLSADTPPFGWAVLVAVGSICLLARPAVPAGLVAVLAIPPLLLGTQVLATGTTWSPYASITEASGSEGPIRLTLDGAPVPPLREAEPLVRSDPLAAVPFDQASGGHPPRVLILGAGAGNEVALALARGAHQVDAVEVDPALVQFGRRRHPGQPYADSRVSVHVTDPRTFLERADPGARYDLILLSARIAGAKLPGVPTPGSSYTLTAEALTQARTVLSPSGVLAVSYDSTEPLLVGRIDATVTRAFGHPPCVYDQATGTPLILTVRARPGQPDSCPSPGGQVRTLTSPSGTGSDTSPVTDDRPALSRHGVPWSWTTWAALALVTVAGVAMTVFAPPHRRRPIRARVRQGCALADRVCGGAAAWLLGVVAASWASRTFGSTWMVASVVLAVALAVVVAGLVVAAFLGRPRGPLASQTGRPNPPGPDPATSAGLAILGVLLGGCLAYGLPVLGTAAGFGAAGVLVASAAGIRLLSYRRRAAATRPRTRIPMPV